ncbi:putative membrane protein [Campylobacter vicugnae]|uniref:Membrane protein n=1 Tax=Campylobacter vicugnae TaxID=1660076 RepID=A0A1X9T2S3_9BACT|nr:putative membrane protein [Campylobacter sp. RM8964]
MAFYNQCIRDIINNMTRFRGFKLILITMLYNNKGVNYDIYIQITIFLLLLAAILNKIFMIDIDLAQYIAICLMVFYYFFYYLFCYLYQKELKRAKQDEIKKAYDYSKIVI